MSENITAIEINSFAISQQVGKLISDIGDTIEKAPVAVILISLNEAHNMEDVLANIVDWAQEIFLVDSYSRDSTVDIALKFGVKVVQRPFRNFGDQWNFAVRELPIQAPWTMKLDPDERMTVELKRQISGAISADDCVGISIVRRLFFMRRAMPIRQQLLRLWRTGSGRFTDVAVNEHPLVDGVIRQIDGELEHHDSPDLEHWLEKQNRYTTAEAIVAYKGLAMADTPKLLGTSFQRRMWIKRHFRYIPLRFTLLFLFNWLIKGAWKCGWVGYIWARLRSEVMWLREIKCKEMEITGNVPMKRQFGAGTPDPRIQQFN